MSFLDLTKILPLQGKWTPSTTGHFVEFEGNMYESGYGLALMGNIVDNGVIECSIKFIGNMMKFSAAVVFRANGQERFYAAEPN